MIKFIAAFLLLLFISARAQSSILNKSNYTRSLQDANTAFCDTSAPNNPQYKSYFQAMTNIYNGNDIGTCLPVHKQCGWVRVESHLPLFVLSVGLEGAGHHLWTELFDKPVFDCVWKNARHYQRDIGDGVPRTTVQMLERGMREQLALRKEKRMPPCKSIYDSEDSFPTGAIRRSGRVFMRPDLINIQKLDGVLFNIKYLLILRNVTDTAMSALRRNFFNLVDEELRTVEHTLTYIEAAMRGAPCHKIFIAHYEHVLTKPLHYLEPLSSFLELQPKQKQILSSRLSTSLSHSKPVRKKHKLTQYNQCKSGGLSSEKCYDKIHTLLEQFFTERGFLWPTFAGNGFSFDNS